MNRVLDALRAAGRWWNAPDGILPWFEHNQGLLSLLALGAALAIAVLEHRRVIQGEVRARTFAEVTRLQAETVAREAELNRRLLAVGQFATAARGLLLDVDADLHEDLKLTHAFMFDDVTFQAPGDLVRRSARAAADTLNILLASTPLSPLLVRSARQGTAALLAIADPPMAVSSQDYRDIYDGWKTALREAGAAITEAEMSYIHQHRPSPPPIFDPLPPSPGELHVH